MKSWLPILVVALAGCLSLHAHHAPTVAKQQPSTAYISAYGPAYNSSDDLLSQILTEVKGLRQDVQRLSGAQTGSGQDALGVVAKRCLSCHQSPASKGDDFVIVRADGSLEDLSPGYRAAIVRKVTRGDMPPSGKLPEAEIKLIADYFGGEKK